MVKVKLLHITSSLKIGGAEHVLFTLVSNLAPATFDQEVIYFHEGPYVEKIRALGIPTHQVRGLFFRYDPIFFWRLYRAIKTRKPDCLHTLLWMANLAGRLCAKMQGISCVSVFHNDLAHDGKVRNLIDRLTLRFADRLVAVSDPVAQSVRKQVDSRAIIEVIRNGITMNPSMILTRTARRLLRANGVMHNEELCKPFVLSSEGASRARSIEGWRFDEEYIIGSVGRFEPVKRYDLLLDCVAAVHARYPHVRLCLIGLGSQEEFLRARARDLGIEHVVQFVIGQPALPYYPQFDCFAQTTAKEGVSIALLEAMSCGVPSVVMHDTPDHPVISHQRDGLVIDASDLAGFQAGIEALMTNKIMAQALGAAGREKVEKEFGVEKMVQKYERLFSSVRPEPARGCERS